MTFTYRVSNLGKEYSAECLELDAVGVGATAEAAVSSLRQLVADRLRPEAVAPPPEESLPEEIELVAVGE